MTALAPVATIARAKPHETGMDIPDGISFDDWLEIGRQLGAIGKRTAWSIADWLCYGDDVFGSEVYDEAEKLFDIQRSALHNYASTARRVCVRTQELSFSHHHQVASLPPSEQRMWLDRCVRERISKNRLAELLEGDRAARDLAPAAPRPRWTLVFPDAKTQATIEAKAEAAGQSVNDWCIATLLAA